MVPLRTDLNTLYRSRPAGSLVKPLTRDLLLSADYFIGNILHHQIITLRIRSYEMACQLVMRSITMELPAVCGVETRHDFQSAFLEAIVMHLQYLFSADLKNQLGNVARFLPDDEAIHCSLVCVRTDLSAAHTVERTSPGRIRRGALRKLLQARQDDAIAPLPLEAGPSSTETLDPHTAAHEAEWMLTERFVCVSLASLHSRVVSVADEE